MKTKIKKLNGTKKWTIRCQRLLDWITKEKINIEKVELYSTSDFNFLGRKHQKEYSRFEKNKGINIGCDTYGYGSHIGMNFIFAIETS